MLQFLPYALAAYGGYKGYKSSKDAGGSGIQRLLGGVTGAAMGYYGGQAGLKAFAPQSFQLLENQLQLFYLNYQQRVVILFLNKQFKKKVKMK